LILFIVVHLLISGSCFFLHSSSLSSATSERIVWRSWPFVTQTVKFFFKSDRTRIENSFPNRIWLLSLYLDYTSYLYIVYNILKKCQVPLFSDSNMQGYRMAKERTDTFLHFFIQKVLKLTGRLIHPKTCSIRSGR